MTNLQEAKLAREAEICYATLAMVTDYDCWHEEEEAVSGEGVMEVLRKNVALAQGVVRRAVAALDDRRTTTAPTRSHMSLITERALVPARRSGSSSRSSASTSTAPAMRDRKR